MQIGYTESDLYLSDKILLTLDIEVKFFKLFTYMSVYVND